MISEKNKMSRKRKICNKQRISSIPILLEFYALIGKRLTRAIIEKQATKVWTWETFYTLN